MEIQYLCPECFKEYVSKIKESKRIEIPDPRDDFVALELNDLGVISGKCRKGHEIFLIIQNPKFEILFDLGVISLIEGYTRESVSGLIASYERFLEYVAIIFLHRLNSKTDLNYDLFEKMKLSERQVGAFSALYLACIHEEPKLITNKTSEFRNDVIHNGYIPTKEEVIEFGDKLLDVMQPILNELKKNFQDEIQKYTMHSLSKKSKQLQPSNQKQISTMCMGTCLGLFNSGKDQKKFSEMIELMDKMKGITFKKFYDQEKNENHYKMIEKIFGKYI